MRTIRLSLASLGLLLTIAPAHAGLFLPPELERWPFPTNPRDFQLALVDRQGVLLDSRDKAVNPQGSFTKRMDDTVKELESKQQQGTLSGDEAAGLAGCYLLRSKNEDALNLLTDAWEKDPRNFKVLSNLALAYHANGIPVRAVGFQEQILDPSVWPKQIPDWSRERLRWQRRVDQTLFSLLKLRGQANAAGAGASREVKLDDLFPGVAFTGPRARFVAGSMSLRMQDQLPPDATALVQQLLLWFPQDNALMWLLAELYNAQGDLKPAEWLFDVLSDSRGIGGVDGELRKHRVLVKEAAAKIKEESGVAQPNLPEQPGIPNTPAPEKPAADNGSSKQDWLPDWRQLGVGFGAGILFGVLLVFQLRQLFRRRPATPH